MEILRGAYKLSSDVLLEKKERKGIEGIVNERQFKETQTYSKIELDKKVDAFNQFLKVTNTNLKFNLHEELNEYYVTIVDQNTNEVVKEIPPKKLLDMYAAMKETLGLFIDKKI
ncbi:flagellar protein FlaG [Bacillus suaedae]|uniref:Flagellar protein FlaG n=1 Tax=Halalkalibacter suaedae TaxID=2822140 RepID=A0A940WQN8_9BACI|nr:flagellar protein FlaG [Bacillus suaedae]MBP3950033.1 flagellar protein FlaG [Bacillus suaedae]